MLRGLLLAGLSLALLTPSTADAQTRERVKITGVRFGLPNGPFGNVSSSKGLFKAGQWAPVYIDLECTRDTEERLLLVVETKDADDVITEGSVEIGSMDKGDRLLANELGRIPYLKPGGTYATVNVKVKGAKSGKIFGESNERSFEAMSGPGYVILGIGTNLGSLRLQTGRGNQEEVDGNNQGMSRELRGGWVETAQLIDVGMMPDQWIGYGAADLVVIGTGGDPAFWEALAAPQHERRRKALVEWVRRGGRAILSVGTNPQVLEPLKEIRDMLPATIPPDGKKTVGRLAYNWLVRGGELPRPTGFLAFPDGKSPFSVVTLQPRADRPSKTLVSEDDKGRVPQVVQGAFGLGRVTLVGFDLDRGPFGDWAQRREFWDNLVLQAGYRLPSPNDKFDKYNRTDDDYTRALQGSLDFFEGVPVVSFGWVALFILIYIVLIGPVDYLFLKKVVKRLEWTWVTFPIIVVTVSAGAYFAAYALKGRDLKTNKVDVVDIDLAGNRVYGNTWFTLFSPRIQNYTIGVEPGGPTWTSADSAAAAHDTVLSWQNTIERNRYGGSGGGGLFSKHYKYQSTNDPQDPNRDLYASGLEGVPIQVWTTKAFGAEWSAPIDGSKPPVSAELSVSRANPNMIIGNVTNHLPFEVFTDAALFWRGKYYDLGTVLPTDVAKPISLSVEQNPDTLNKWLSGPRNTYVPPKQAGYTYGSESAGTTTNPKFALWPVLFTDALSDNRSQAPNASLRRMDQSWRVAEDRPENAILVLRIATREGAQAEDMARDPASPSRLWLGDLPTSGGTRPTMQGTLKQETYIRVFIPVKQPPVKK
jgi:hypothetical protein